MTPLTLAVVTWQALDDALKDLNITKDQNATLKEKVNELVRRYEEATADIAQSRKVLEALIKNWGGGEGLSLGQQIAWVIDQVRHPL